MDSGFWFKVPDFIFSFFDLIRIFKKVGFFERLISIEISIILLIGLNIKNELLFWKKIDFNFVGLGLFFINLSSGVFGLIES